MNYDFDRVIDRTRTNSIKWNKDFLKEKFESDEIIPFWVADMDIQCPKPVISEEREIECILRCIQWKLERTIDKIDLLLEKGKISEAQVNYLKGEILEIIR